MLRGSAKDLWDRGFAFIDKLQAQLSENGAKSKAGGP